MGRAQKIIEILNQAGDNFYMFAFDSKTTDVGRPWPKVKGYTMDDEEWSNFDRFTRKVSYEKSSFLVAHDVKFFFEQKRSRVDWIAISAFLDKEGSVPSADKIPALIKSLEDESVRNGKAMIAKYLLKSYGPFERTRNPEVSSPQADYKIPGKDESEVSIEIEAPDRVVVDYEMSSWSGGSPGYSSSGSDGRTQRMKPEKIADFMKKMAKKYQ